MPRVSVIVPAYNAAEHIEATLASVVAQTYTDWEVVVGDDASTDDTAARAERVDPRVHVVRAEANAGPAPARNLAIAHAQGELLAFLDADDAWRPEYLAVMVGLYDSATAGGRRVGIVSCDAQIVGPDGTPRDHAQHTDRRERCARPGEPARRQHDLRERARPADASRGARRVLA